MDLKEFVTQTLCSIMDGVKAAQANHADIAPYCFSDGGKKSGIVAPSNRPVSEVEFDVAITASDQSNQGVNAGIKVVNFFSASTEGKIESIKQKESVSRVRFSVPVCFTQESL